MGYRERHINEEAAKGAFGRGVRGVWGGVEAGAFSGLKVREIENDVDAAHVLGTFTNPVGVLGRKPLELESGRNP